MKCHDCKKEKYTTPRNPPALTGMQRFKEKLGYKTPIMLCDDCYQRRKEHAKQ